MEPKQAFVILLNVADYVSPKGVAYTEAGAIRACEKIAKEEDLRRRYDDSTEWRARSSIVEKVLWYQKAEIVDGVLDRLADIK